MNINNVDEQSGLLSFTLEQAHLPFINGLRRTILSDIPVVGIKGFPHDDCNINIIENDTILNNEIMKHRIMSIPVYALNPESNDLWSKLKIVLNVQNDTEQMKHVTTENITLINTETGTKISDATTKKIFPPDPLTNDYILLCYLQPVSDKMKKSNQLYFEATFSLLSPKDSSVYNCVSKSTFSNTIDLEKQELGWSEYQKTLPPDANIEKEKQNWKVLKGQHYFKENSFDFAIKSIGFYTNKEILIKAFNIIINNLDYISKKTGVKIEKSKKTSMENSFDIIIQNHSYTIGNILKKIAYDLFYGKDITYVGFVVEHPHDSFSILRLTYNSIVDEERVLQTLQETCIKSIEYIQQILSLVEHNL